MLSGPPYEELREGWALLARGGLNHQPVPHYWRRLDLTDHYSSLCGLAGNVGRTITGQKVIFHPGDFLVQRCSKCSLKRSRLAAGGR
jgi:hypothetical protein